ncbi:oligogalacturonate lyase family protein [Lelliottia sp. V106_10]|uniref:oligogalacturonate lyase family protein n=1 Tax=Lelliottia wanjuensis TaxID=3050585 RepID=UPI00254D27C5|nr:MULTISPECIES: oligogalacturonate lyase family protein [unclassified Lelliottia]MDK9354682.1 oligogalacturonate lyase family protein [Lelliottia sp. V106_16]MDK9371889.1 oligogalacturonate lyase family protein [Lelliottia sp. V106_10]MDK9598526.1 oligogalacturonate lyase family protein [Lelliottia sp. V106_5]
MKGKIIPLNFRTRLDSQTGHEVIRMTPPHIICHRNYFYQKCFTQDGSKLIFGGAFEGHWNYYLLDIAGQQATQLTDGAGDNTFGGFLSADDQSLWYVKNSRELRRVCLESFEEQIVYQVDDEWVAYGTWVANSDCTKLVGIEIKKRDWQPLTDWSKFRAFYFTQPECRLINIDLRTGEQQVILQEKRWLGHPIYRPFDDSTVAFCHEGPRDAIDARMWLINRDGSNLRKVRQHAAGESFTHEFWVPDGSALYYVAHKEKDPQRYLCSADPLTLENRQLMAIPPCSHLMSNHDGSLIVGDGAPHNTGDISLNDPFIWVFDIKAATQKAICQHNTSWKVLDGDRQVTHPHPSFSPDNQWVLYTSDEEGMPALYLARV